MDQENNVQAAIDAGRQIGGISERWDEILGIPVALVPPSAQLNVLEGVIARADQRAPAPREINGKATHQELESFIAHANRFKTEHSAVFADTSAVKLTAVYDYHKGPAAPAWGRHRSEYTCPLSEQWKTWTTHSGQKLTQEVFAQFIEDHLDDLASPVGNGEDKDLPMPAEVLTMARNLVIRSKGEFSRTINPTTGEGSLVCRNENETTSTRIPRAFLLGIPVFEAGALYRVEARMRMDMSSGRPIFAYVLYRPEEIKRDAFGEVRKAVIDKTSLPVFAGSPE